MGVFNDFINYNPLTFILILGPIYSTTMMLLNFNKYKISLILVLLIAILYGTIYYTADSVCSKCEKDENCNVSNKKGGECYSSLILTLVGFPLVSLLINIIYFISSLFQKAANTKISNKKNSSANTNIKNNNLK